jgi:hypothetical protein
MAMALKTEWVIYSEGIDIDNEVEALERYCVGNVRVFKGDFEHESVMKMTTKFEFDVLAETDMDEFWDLVYETIDDENEE